MTVADEVIYRGHQLIIPISVRSQILKKLHSSHIGIQSSIRRAREVMYWPGMNGQIKDFIEKCDICNSYRSQQAKEPMISHPVSERPWQRVGADIFDFD